MCVSEFLLSLIHILTCHPLIIYLSPTMYLPVTQYVFTCHPLCISLRANACATDDQADAIQEEVDAGAALVASDVVQVARVFVSSPPSTHPKSLHSPLPPLPVTHYVFTCHPLCKAVDAAAGVEKGLRSVTVPAKEKK